MSDYDNWLMTDPWNKPHSVPTVSEIWNDDVTEDQMFEFGIEDGDFQEYLIFHEVVPEEIADDPDKVDAYVAHLWGEGNKDLLHYLGRFYETNEDMVERLVHRYWGYLYE